MRIRDGRCRRRVASDHAILQQQTSNSHDATLSDATPSQNGTAVKIILAAVGRLKNGSERDLCARYLERAQASARGVALTGVEMKEIDEGRARRVEDRKAEEAKALAGFIADGARLIVLDERGRAISSADFAADIGRARDDGAPAYALVIGGPDGIDPDLRAKAHKVIAFGAMTWPHQLVRIMAAEQIYRAITILAGHPYHRV